MPATLCGLFAASEIVLNVSLPRKKQQRHRSLWVYNFVFSCVCQLFFKKENRPPICMGKAENISNLCDGPDRASAAGHLFVRQFESMWYSTALCNNISQRAPITNDNILNAVMHNGRGRVLLIPYLWFSIHPRSNKDRTQWGWFCNAIRPWINVMHRTSTAYLHRLILNPFPHLDRISRTSGLSRC